MSDTQTLRQCYWGMWRVKPRQQHSSTQPELSAGIPIKKIPKMGYVQGLPSASPLHHPTVHPLSGADPFRTPSAPPAPPALFFSAQDCYSCTELGVLPPLFDPSLFLPCSHLTAARSSAASRCVAMETAASRPEDAGTAGNSFRANIHRNKRPINKRAEEAGRGKRGL